MKQKNLPDIGEKLHTARREQGLSLRDLASKAGVSASLLSQIESGKVVPSVTSLFRVATALVLPIDTFFPSAESAQAHVQISPAENPVLPYVPIQAAHEPRHVRHIEHDAVIDPVVHPDTRKIIELMGGVTWARLTPSAEKGLEFIEVRYNVGAISGAELLSYNGREFGLILEGELQIELGFECYILKVGDSIIFDSTVPHRLTNVGQIPVRAMWCTIRSAISQ